MTPEEEEARDRLLFYLENETGFWFGMVVGDDPRPRARLCEAAAAWCKENGRTFVLHEPDPEGLVKLAVTLANDASPGVHWVRAGGVKGVIEAWNAGAAQMLMAMNERREAYRKRLDGGIVVEGRSALKRILREMAPDLFSIRAFIAEPGEEPRARAEGFPEWQRPISLTSFVSGEQVDANLALERLARLTALEGPTTTMNWVHAEGRAMASLYNAGRFDEAARHANELLSRLKPGADSSLEAFLHRRSLAYMVLAQIALRSGDSSKALTLLECALEVLRLYPPSNPGERFFCGLEVLRIHRQRAVLLACNGDIGAARAEFDRYAEALPSVAGLPPEMSVELLGGCISMADILVEQGKLDAAEEILQKAAQVSKECVAEHSEDDRWKLEAIRSHAALGRVYLRKDDIVGAVQTLMPATLLAERLDGSASLPGPWRDVLEGFYFDVGFVLSHVLNYSEFIDCVQCRALANVRQKFEREPDGVRLGWLLANWYLHRVELIEKDNLAGAKEAAQQALDLVPRLPIRDSEDADLKTKIEALRAFVQKPRKKRRPAKP